MGLYEGFKCKWNNDYLDDPLFEEAQALCEKIAILNKGELIACNDTTDLLARVNLKVININTAI